jgi:hypothetical protein
MLQRRVVRRSELLELGRIAGREREQLQHVQAEEAGWVEQAELAGDQGAVVAAVHPVRVVAEPAHEGVVGAGDAGDGPAAVGDRGGEGEARRRRDHDRERVLGPATVRHRIGQRPDHVQEVGERAGVAVREQQRRRARLGRRHVQEVHGLPVDLGQVVREGVHPRLLSAPVEAGAPALHHLGEVRVRGAVVPAVAGCGPRQPGQGQPGGEVVQVGLGDVDHERADGGVAERLGHGLDATSLLGSICS